MRKGPGSRLVVRGTDSERGAYSRDQSLRPARGAWYAFENTLAPLLLNPPELRE